MTLNFHADAPIPHLVPPRDLPTVSIRELLPFAGATLLAFALVPIGAPVSGTKYGVALALVLAVFAGTALTPWERVPAAARLVPPAVFLCAAALLRDSGGGFTSGVATLALIPVFWVALHGTRAGLGITVLGVVAFLALPVIVIGDPRYPTTALKTGVLFVVVAGLVGVTVQRLVTSVRLQAGEGARREGELQTAAREREVLLARLERLATTDPLTGVGNRRAWDRAIDRALADRRAQPLAVGLLDLDHFKAYNDEHGHDAGDKLLAATARAWLAELRPSDALARIGGEEFAVLLPACEADDAHSVLTRMARATPHGLTCSGGIATWDGIEDAESLLRRADHALYGAKRNGRNRIEQAAPSPVEVSG